MQQIALQPLMRKIWRAMRTFNVPIDHPIIQNLTEFDLSFIEWSTALDDPKLREKIENTVYDDDFDEWYDKCMNESEEAEYTDSEDAPTEVKDDEYADLSESPDDAQIDDWEEVE